MVGPEKRRVLFLSCLLLGGVGCGAATPHGSTVPRPTQLPDGAELATLTPPEARSFLFIDLAAIRRSALYREMESTFEVWGETLAELEDSFGEMERSNPFLPLRPDRDQEEPGAEQASDDSDEDPPPIWEVLTRPDWIFVATDPREERAGGVAFFGARFSDAEARELVRSAAGGTDLPGLPMGLGAEPPSDPLDLGVAPEEPVEAVSVEVGDRRGFAALEYRLVEAAAGFWILGSEDDVRGVFNRWEAAPTPNETMRLRDRLGLFDHAVVFSVEDVGALRELLVEEDEPMPPWVRRLEAAGFRMDFSAGITVSAAFQAGRARDARRTGREAQASLRTAAGSDHFLRLFGLTPHLMEVEPRIDADRVWLDLALDARESSLFLARVSGAFSATLLAMQAVGEFARGFGGGLDLDHFGGSALDAAREGDYFEVDSSTATLEAVDSAIGLEASDACTGWIGDVYHPLRLDHEMDGVRVIVVGEENTPLGVIVELEDGTFRCGRGRELSGAFPAGEHRIWVSTPESYDYSRYRLTVTMDAGLSADDIAPPPADEPAEEWSGRHGDITWTPGGASQSELGVAGGSVDASETDPSCVGRVEYLPNHILTLEETVERLRILVRSNGTSDLTLIVRNPDDSFRCDDDSGGQLNPLVEGRFEPGEYLIWVGRLDGADETPYSLTVTEDPRLGLSALPAP